MRNSFSHLSAEVTGAALTHLIKTHSCLYQLSVPGSMVISGSMLHLLDITVPQSIPHHAASV